MTTDSLTTEDLALIKSVLLEKVLYLHQMRQRDGGLTPIVEQHENELLDLLDKMQGVE